jgi:hypothetical protein
MVGRKGSETLAGASGERVRASLVIRLKARRMEIERAILTRISATSDSVADDDEYVDGLQRAVSAGVSYGLVGLEREEDRGGQIPAALFDQARLAARRGLSIDVVLRRFFVSYTLFGDFILAAAEDDPPLRGPAFGSVLHAQAPHFERLVVAVIGEYMRESRNRLQAPQGRQIESVRKLLAGESVDTDALAYEFGDWHVGAIARGEFAVAALRDVAKVADRRLLLAHPQEGTAWAWFAGRHRIAVAEIAGLVSLEGGDDALVALGEPARGVDGWRLTHQQAGAAFRVARHSAEKVVRYADVSLLASISQDQLLANSLHQLYLAPLADARDGGAGLRKTLRAYFTSGRNISSAASALGVSRQTVGNRLRAIEEKLGKTLESCAPEIEVALRLEGIDDAFGSAPTSPPPLQY